MEQAPLRKSMPGPSLPGPTLIRLLARLAGAEVAPAGNSLPDRLSQWFDWNQALVLATALDGKLAAVMSDLPMSSHVKSDECECARARASLAASITADAGVPATDDYALFRQRHLSLQRSMQAATGKLRCRLRDRLAQTSDKMARLAEVDAVMELALSPREQKLLATVPALLGEHFERLRQTAQTREHHAAAVTSVWLERFRHDMQSVLLAELDVRFQPIEGLLAALRTSVAGSHVQKSA